MGDSTTDEFDKIMKATEAALSSGTKLLERQQADIFNEALENTQEQNKNLKVKFYEYLSSFDTEKKKNYYKRINEHAGNKELAKLLNEYNKIKEETQNAIVVNNLLSNINSNSLDQNQYYKLKNLDIINKLDDIKGTKLTNRRKAFYQNEYIDLARYYKSRFRGIYFLLALIYLALMFKKKKYTQHKYWGIFVAILLYPFMKLMA